MLSINHLSPIDSNDSGMNMRAVYRDQQIFFKPGQEIAKRTLLCQEMCKLIGLSHVIPPAELGSRNIIAPEDVNVTYKMAETSTKKPILLDLNQGPVCTPIKDRKTIYALIDDEKEKFKLYSSPDMYILEDDAENLNPDTFDSFYLLVNFKGKDYLVPKSNELITDSSGKFVIRNEERYAVRETKEGVVVQGDNIQGLVQTAVSPLFTKFPDQQNALDLRREDKYATPFFKLIAMSQFIDCFIVMMLIRTQDGKAANLEDSNVLYEKTASGLQPRLIDLDPEETFPPSNSYSSDAKFKGKVHVLRCGLMGYPQAHESLTKENQAFLLDRIHGIFQNKEALASLMAKGLQSDPLAGKKVIALTEVIDRLNTFKETPISKKEPSNPNEWSLADLLFSVFPEYHQQWIAYEQKERFSVMDIAAAVGFADPTPAQKRVQSNPSNAPQASTVAANAAGNIEDSDENDSEVDESDEEGSTEDFSDDDDDDQITGSAVSTVPLVGNSPKYNSFPLITPSASNSPSPVTSKSRYSNPLSGG